MMPSMTRGCLRTVGVSILFVASYTSALAAEQDKAIVNPLITLGKLAVALTVVLAVFWLFARFMRHVQGVQGGVHQGLKIVGALSVGQRERVLIVQAGDEQLVLGVTSSQINTLHVLETPLIANTRNIETGDFKAKLTAALKREVPAE